MIKLNVLPKPALIVLLMSVTIYVTGCSVMPAFGPSSDSIIDAAQQKKTDGSKNDESNKYDSDQSPIVPFQLIDVSSATLPVMHQKDIEEFSADFLNHDYLLENQKIIPGDTLLIRIWETANDGLFSSSGQRENAFTLTVSNSGGIDVPYAGNVGVADQSIHQVREELLRRYKGQAIDPEINVQIQETTSRSISVLGAVVAPGRIIIPAQGIKLYDLIALAGGIPHPPWETTVSVFRSGHVTAVSLANIIDQPRNNIVMLPGDVVYVDHIPRKFSMYGAIIKPGNIVINTPSPNLSELLAESGGLVDLQSEASSVFVFRINRQGEDSKSVMATAYRLDFSKPDVFLLAEQFAVLPSDIVYVATAGASEFRKFITTLLSPFLGGTGGIQNLGQ